MSEATELQSAPPSDAAGPPRTLDYIPPAADVRRRPGGALTRAAVALGCYPGVVFASLYATWLAARASLGHWPRPMLDDPQSISPVVTALGTITTLLLVGGFAAAVVHFPLTLLAAGREARLGRGGRAVGLLLLFVVAWVGGFLLLRWDPARAMYWLAD